MSEKIEAFGNRDKFHYAVVYSGDASQVYSTDSTGLVTFDDSDFVDYELLMTQLGTSGLFTVDFPASLPDGDYLVEIREKDAVDAVPALDDPSIGNGPVAFGVSSDSVLNETVDGITVKSLLTSLLAVVAGKSEVVSATRVKFKDRDGNTKVDIVYGAQQGQRTSSTIS